VGAGAFRQLVEYGVSPRERHTGAPHAYFVWYRQSPLSPISAHRRKLGGAGKVTTADPPLTQPFMVRVLLTSTDTAGLSAIPAHALARPRDPRRARLEARSCFAAVIDSPALFTRPAPRCAARSPTSDYARRLDRAFADAPESAEPRGACRCRTARLLSG